MEIQQDLNDIENPKSQTGGEDNPSWKETLEDKLHRE